MLRRILAERDRIVLEAQQSGVLQNIFIDPKGSIEESENQLMNTRRKYMGELSPIRS